MRLTARWFWFDEHGEARRIPARKWQRIMQGDDRMPAFAGQRRTIAQAILNVERREVIEVVQLTGWRHRFDDRGALDRARSEAGMRLTLDTLALGEPWGQLANVRSLAPRIAERRLATEFGVTLTGRQRDAVLQAIWTS